MEIQADETVKLGNVWAINGSHNNDVYIMFFYTKV